MKPVPPVTNAFIGTRRSSRSQLIHMSFRAEETHESLSQAARFLRRMRFADVVAAYETIEGTTKRLQMTERLVGLLRATPKEDIDKVAYLTHGRIHPDYEGIELGLAEKMVIRVVAHATGLEESRIERMWKEKGDLGLVAEEAIASSARTTCPRTSARSRGSSRRRDWMASTQSAYGFSGRFARCSRSDSRRS